VYGFNIRLKTDLEQAVRRVTEALKTEGFGVLADTDVKKTMKEELGVDRRPYALT
jgi:uncharacterized protein (DUF302 family)